MLLAKELLCVLLGSGLVAGTYFRVTRKGFGRLWPAGFILLSIAGIVLAFRLMSIRYLVTPTERAYGVPFVIAGGDLINGKWADGGVGFYMPLPFLANLAFGMAVCVLPLAIVSFFRPRKVATEGATGDGARSVRCVPQATLKPRRGERE